MSWFNNITSNNAHFRTEIAYDNEPNTELHELTIAFQEKLQKVNWDLAIHNSPIQTKFKNPFKNTLVWILDEPRLENWVIHIDGKGEIYWPIRDITRIWKEARKSFFEVNDCPEREAEIARILQPLNSAYALAKQVFEWRFRQVLDKNGMKFKYFKHLKWAASNIIKLSLEEENRYEKPEIYVERVIIAFLHDIMEDIKISFQTLEETFGTRVALWVLAISKDPWEDFIPETDTESLETLEKYKRREIYKDDDEYQAVVTKYKSIRNESYFKHFTSFDAFKNNMRLLCEWKWLSITNEELEELARNSILSKFADRIDNLKTEWDPNNIIKVKRKIAETKKYFLPITEEVCEKAHDIMLKEIIKLEELLSWNEYLEISNGWDDFENEKATKRQFKWNISTES